MRQFIIKNPIAILVLWITFHIQLNLSQHIYHFKHKLKWMISIYTKFNIPNFQGCSFLCMLLWRGFFCTRIKLVAPTRLQLRAGMDITSQYFDNPPSPSWVWKSCHGLTMNLLCFYIILFNTGATNLHLFHVSTILFRSNIPCSSLL